jgi:hypothetical protein
VPIAAHTGLLPGYSPDLAAACSLPSALRWLYRLTAKPESDHAPAP